MRSRIEEEKLLVVAIMVLPLRSSNGRLRAANDAIAQPLHNRRPKTIDDECEKRPSFSRRSVVKSDGKGGRQELNPFLRKILKTPLRLGSGYGCALLDRECFCSELQEATSEIKRMRAK